MQSETDELQKLLEGFVEARNRILEITSKVHSLPQLKAEIDRLSGAVGQQHPRNLPVKGSEM